MYNVKPTSDGKPAAGSENEDVRPNGDVQITTSQRYPVIGECKNVPMSTDERNNQQLLAEERETEASKKLEDATRDSFGGRKQINVEGEAHVEKKTHVETSEPTVGRWAKSKGRKRAFSLLDTLISLSMVGPSVIGFWRGIWTLMDLHADLFPDWFCFTFGAFLHVIFAFYQGRCHNMYIDEWTKSSALRRLPYRTLRILYTYTFGVACNAHWRGGWIIISDYFLMHIWITTCLMCLLLACLAVLRCVRNLIAPPLIIFIDRPAYIFQFPTRYNMKSSAD